MKLYNEKEIGAILKRAAELSHDDADSDSVGLSVEELKQLGREAGINPDFILKAATELGSKKSRRSEKNFYGGPVAYENEIVLDREITPSEWEDMLVEMRSCIKDPGVVSARENTFEWTVQSTGTKSQVTARIENGRTKIHLFWSEPTAPIPFLVPTIIGTIISLPIVFEALQLSGLPSAMVIMSVTATLFTLGRWGVSAYTDRFSRKLDQLMTQFELIALKGSKKTQTLVAQAPVLDLDEPDTFEPGEHEKERPRSRGRS
jgi:type III secretory pathway component EscS